MRAPSENLSLLQGPHDGPARDARQETLQQGQSSEVISRSEPVLVRYAGSQREFVPTAGPHDGPARDARQETLQQGQSCEGISRSEPVLVRYAGSQREFVPTAGPHDGPGARSAPRDTATRQGL